MKYFVLALLAFAAIAGSSAQIAPGTLENIDVDSMLRNSRYVRTQINCVLNRGKCDKTGRDLKTLLPEYLNRRCNACSPTQRVNSDKIVNFMKRNHPSDWVSIEATYSA